MAYDERHSIDVSGRLLMQETMAKKRNETNLEDFRRKSSFELQSSTASLSTDSAYTTGGQARASAELDLRRCQITHKPDPDPKPNRVTLIIQRKKKLFQTIGIPRKSFLWCRFKGLGLQIDEQT